MIVLPRTEIRPYYAQVAMFDPSVTDAYPEWEGGGEEAVSIWHGIAVATRPDDRGTVGVEVRRRDDECEAADRRILEATLIVRGTGVLVGSVTGNVLYEIPLAPGAHQVTVHVRGEKNDVTEVCFLIDPK